MRKKLMNYAFLPHFGSTWLCETQGPQVNPLARVPGSNQANRKFSTDGSEFGFREQAGKKIAHYRLLAQAPWFECLTPPTALPASCVADDFVIHDGVLIAGGRSKTAEALWVHAPGAEQPWSSIPLPDGLGVMGKSIDALFVRDHTLVAIDNMVWPKWILLYELSPSLSAQGVEKVDLPAHTSYERVSKSAEGKGVYALYSTGMNHGVRSFHLSLLCSKTLRERVLWRASIDCGSAFFRQSQSVEPIEPMTALFKALQQMAFCGEFLFLALGTLGLQVSDAAFHRQPEWRTSAAMLGNPFSPVPLQKIVDVQRLECPRGQDFGLYVVGLDAVGKLAYEWLGMEQLTATIFGVPPRLALTEEQPYVGSL